MPVNNKEALEGLKAVPFKSCKDCDLNKTRDCQAFPCTPDSREDNSDVMFKKIKEGKIKKKLPAVPGGYPVFMQGIPEYGGYDGVVCFVGRQMGFAVSGHDAKEGAVHKFWSDSLNPAIWKPYLGKVVFKCVNPHELAEG